MDHRHRSRNQFSITKGLCIPDVKPDVERILRVTTSPKVNKISTISGKVIVTGELNIDVEYVAMNHCHSQPMHFVAFKVPFTHFVDHCSAKPWKDAKVAVSVEFQEVQLINRRAINFFVIINIVILRLDGVKTLMKSQVCTSQNISNTCNSGHPALCFEVGSNGDCSVEQPCACVIHGNSC